MTDLEINGCDIYNFWMYLDFNNEAGCLQQIVDSDILQA